MNAFILVSLSGLLGIWLRYFAGLSLEKVFVQPWAGTVIINIVGSLIAGTIFALFTEKALISETTAMILLVGFCGGFTTFSAYSLQNLQLITQGHYAPVVLHFLLAPVLGLLATYVGVGLVRFSC